MLPCILIKEVYMSNKVVFDDGLIRLDINGNGILKFNPTDFNLYERFFALTKELPEIEKKYAAEIEDIPEKITQEQSVELTGRELERAKAIDAEVKTKLSNVFGVGNDFDKLLGGVNIMAFGTNGERIITNLLNALMPYVENGVKKYANDEAKEAKANREQRRAMQRGKA